MSSAHVLSNTGPGGGGAEPLFGKDQQTGSSAGVPADWDRFVLQGLMSFGTVGRGSKRRKGLTCIGMSAPVSVPPTLPEWKCGNLESRAPRVTCQIPFAGLCYAANTCRRLGQTPHLGVRNASPGRGRGLVRHPLLNQCEGEDGASPALLASDAGGMLGAAERGAIGVP